MLIFNATDPDCRYPFFLLVPTATASKGWFFIWRILFCFSELEKLILYFKKTFINFQHQIVTLLVLLSPNQPRKRPHQRRGHVKPIKLQDAHLTNFTGTSPKSGDWVGKETLKDQHTASPQTVKSSHSQKGHQCAQHQRCKVSNNTKFKTSFIHKPLKISQAVTDTKHNEMVLVEKAASDPEKGDEMCFVWAKLSSNGPRVALQSDAKMYRDLWDIYTDKQILKTCQR